MRFILSGGKKLSGEIDVNGAKNAAIKMIAGSILIKDEVVLKNVPDIIDIKKISEILIKMGAEINRNGHTLTINTINLKNQEPDFELVKSIRASVVLIGPLLARFGWAKIQHPGGDKIGSRPIDRHIKAFETLGINVKSLDNFYEFEVNKLADKDVIFEKITVTGTENIILFACGKNIRVKIINAAVEPEILDLISFLNKAGAKIDVTDRQIIIVGNENLKGLTYEVISDRIEAGTFACLASATKSELKINHCNPKHLTAFLDILRNIGVRFDIGEDFLYIKESKNLNSVNIKTSEYPGLSTDLHPPLGVLLTQCSGTSNINETIFENRLGYLNELKTMGANIEIINSREARITGLSILHGAEIESLNIRAGATLIIAGLLAKGESVIKNAEIIDRGYENIESRLSKLGAEIKRVD